MSGLMVKVALLSGLLTLLTEPPNILISPEIVICNNL